MLFEREREREKWAAEVNCFTVGKLSFLPPSLLMDLEIKIRRRR